MTNGAADRRETAWSAAATVPLPVPFSLGRFELANDGTLFLDEIANMPPILQAKLLRVVESGEFERVGSSRTLRTDVRLLSATNADLGIEIGAGRFRQDLLFRLNTIEIQLPPLRNRREDIPALAALFLAQHTGRYRKDITGLEPSALQALVEHSWPGNIRELDHALERAVLMAQGTTIRRSELGLRPDRDGPGHLEAMSPRRWSASSSGRPWPATTGT